MRKRINYVKLREHCEQLIKEKRPDIDYEEVYGQRDKDFAFRSAIRLCRLFSADYSKLLANTRQFLPGFSTKVLMVPATPGNVRVFINLPIDYWPDTAHAQHLTVWTHGVGVLETFWNNYKADLADAKRCQAWSTTQRAWTRLRRSENMTLAAAITRYGTQTDVSASRIRDVAEYVAEMYRPLTISYAETPEDFLEMYMQDGPDSCMRDHADRDWYDHLNPHGITATSWFAFHPYIKGAYLKRGGRVENRCLIYQKEDGNWYYGRDYYRSGGGQRERFLEALRKEGIQELEDGAFHRDCEFTIPAYMSDDRPVCPAPYMDNLRSTINVSYSKLTKQFHFQLTKPGGRGNFQCGTGGYTRGEYYADRVACAHCGTMHEHTSAMSFGDDSYCSASCAREAGLIQTTRRNGSMILMPIGTVIVDALRNGRAYEHERAAEAHASPFYALGPNIVPEFPAWTAGGYYSTTPQGYNIRTTLDYRDVQARRNELPEGVLSVRTVRAFDYDESGVDTSLIELPPAPAAWQAVYVPHSHVAIDFTFTQLGDGVNELFVQVERNRMQEAA